MKCPLVNDFFIVTTETLAFNFVFELLVLIHYSIILYVYIGIIDLIATCVFFQGH